MGGVLCLRGGYFEKGGCGLICTDLCTFGGMFLVGILPTFLIVLFLPTFCNLRIENFNFILRLLYLVLWVL